MSGHAFLAVGLSDDERHALAAALAAASPGRPIPGKRPPERNWHITLRFLGECSDAGADRVIHEVEENLAASPGRVFASGLGAFRRPSKASVLYASVDDPEGLLGYLAGVCEEAAREVGFEPDERPFIPHLTLSRLRPPADLSHLMDSFGVFRVPIAVRSITLFRTTQSRAGITHHPLHKLDLTLPS